MGYEEKRYNIMDERKDMVVSQGEEEIYIKARTAMGAAHTEETYQAAAELFATIPEYKDAAELAKVCAEKARISRGSKYYKLGMQYKVRNTLLGYEAAIKNFEMIPDWEDAAEQIEECRRNYEELRKKEEERQLKREAEIKKEKAKLKKIVLCVMVVIVVAAAAFYGIRLYANYDAEVIQPENKYKEAIALMESGQGEKAVVIFEELNGYKDSEKRLEKYYKELYGEERFEEIRAFLMCAIGKDLKFGNYHGADRWILLARENGKALLVSKQCIDCKRYHKEHTELTWEECSIREWLNNEFYNEAFSEEEKMMIAESRITNPDNSVYRSESGNDTLDKVFLLSIEEVEKYFPSQEKRCASASSYAKEMGAYISANGNSWWWLRTTGSTSGDAAGVCGDGEIDYGGYFVHYEKGAVRPAIWVDLGV